MEDKLTIDGQITDLAKKGVVFNIMNEDEAKKFLRYNNYYFKDSTIYDFAQREDRFYVLVDSNNVIKEIFDTRLFDISTDDFELIENKYYPKKGKRS